MPPPSSLSVNVGAGTRKGAPAPPATWAGGETKGGFGRDRSSSRGSYHSPGSPSHRKRAKSPGSPKSPLSPSKATKAAHDARKKSHWGKVQKAKTHFAVARSMSKVAAEAAKRSAEAHVIPCVANPETVATEEVHTIGLANGTHDTRISH